MDPRSIPRHLRDIHGQEIPKSVCIDEGRGIYILRKSSKGGVPYPIHVQKTFSSLESIRIKGVPFCEDDRCRDYMDVFFVVGFFSLDGKIEAMPGENCAFYGCSTSRKHGLSLFKIPSARADESEETSTLKKKARQAWLNLILRTRQSTPELKQRIETNNI